MSQHLRALFLSIDDRRPWHIRLVKYRLVVRYIMTHDIPVNPPETTNISDAVLSTNGTSENVVESWDNHLSR